VLRAAVVYVVVVLAIVSSVVAELRNPTMLVTDGCSANAAASARGSCGDRHAW